MRNLRPLEPEHAAGKARDLLQDIVDRHGTAGDMVRTMAHSPAVLQGYLDLSRAMKRGKLPRPLTEKISLGLQEWIGCDSCLTAHADAGKSVGLSENDIALARQATATDAREANLIGFAVRVLAEPAAISHDDVAALRSDGWTDRDIAEVAGIVALNLLTGAFNLVAGI